MPIFLLDRRPILRRLGGSKGVFTEVWQGHNDGMVERIRSIGFFCFIFRTVEFWNSWVVLFFSLKWKNKKKLERASWAKPPELLDAKDGQLQTSQPPLRLPQRITQVSCGWRHSVGIATGFPDVFGGSACIFVKHGEHLWHAQAGTCNCLNARYFFGWYLRCTWKCSLPYATNTWTIRPGGLQRTTEGPNSEHPIKINQRYQRF